MSSEDMIQLGYSEDIYRNVGRLCTFTQGSRDDSQYTTSGSVTYYRGKVCFTNAHCLTPSAFSKKKYYKVYFEIKRGIKTFFTVAHYAIHPNASKSLPDDIAIIILDREPSGLSEFELIDINSISKEKNNDGICDLTYVGYGHRGMDRDFFLFFDNDRKALRSQFLIVNSGLILSAGYGVTHDPVTKIMKPRKLLENEAIKRPGMSGGATFYGNALVGLNSGGSYSNCSPVDQRWCDTLSALYELINPFLFNFFGVALNNPVPVASQFVSIPLYPYKDWIEGVVTSYGNQDRANMDIV